MSTQPESRISRAILDYLKRQRIFAFKVHGGPNQMAGLPDILACVDGIFVGLEVKVPGKRHNTSLKQKRVHQLIGESGGLAFVVCSVPEVEALIVDIRAQIKAAGNPLEGWEPHTKEVK